MGILGHKIAVITGGTRGFGLAVAKAYTQEGAVVVVGSRSQASVDRALEDLRSRGAQASGIVCDVADPRQTQALADHAIETFGHFDIWVNNAAISPPYGPTIHVSPEAFLEATQTNILGTYYGSLVAMRHFLGRGEGKLVNILGAGDRRPQPMQSAYSASKAWILSFTSSLAKEYAHSGVGVFAFNPGMMDTDMLLNVEVVAGYESRLDRFEAVLSVLSQPVEIPARKAIWLASSETDGRTGLVVRELTRWKMLRGALHEAANALFNRPKRSFDIQITSVPSAFPDNLNERP